MIRAALALLLVPALAAAYSDRLQYDDPAIVGGGGGRYFTGSRVDGNSCSVCHTGKVTDAFTVEVPQGDLVRGQRYDITIRWSDPATQHALHLEVSAAAGAPVVTIPAAAALPAASRCNGTADGLPAVYTIEAGQRRIVGVEPCGASMMTASVVATGGPMELTIGAVIGDSSDTAAGDATFERRITFGVHAAESSGGCAVGDGGSLGVLLALAGVVRARSRTAR